MYNIWINRGYENEKQGQILNSNQSFMWLHKYTIKRCHNLQYKSNKSMLHKIAKQYKWIIEINKNS